MKHYLSKNRGLKITALIIFVVLTIWSLPATWVAKQSLGDQQALRLEGVGGSLWSGFARDVKLRSEGQVYGLGKVSWRWQPQAALLFRACFAFESRLRQQSSDGVACRHWNGDWSLVDTSFRGPTALVKMWLPIQVSGGIALDVENLRMNDNRIIALDARADWYDAAFHDGQSWLKLESFRANITSDEDGMISAKIRNSDEGIEHPMVVDLLLRSAYQKSTSVSGYVDVSSKAPPAIEQWLQALGFTQEGERYNVDWNL